MTGRIPATIISEVRDRTDIVSVIQRFVPLKKAGRNYAGLCPFHADKDPSFTVSPQRQMFHCFGCGKGGDVFAFLMEIQGKTFVEVVEDLAREAGVKIPRDSSPGSRQEEKKRTELLKLNEAAADFYEKMLLVRDGGPGRDYIIERGVDEGTVELFRLGYAPDGWHGFCEYLKRKGMSMSLAAEVGLVSKGRGGYFDVFRNRLMFPIFGEKGRVVGFGGRLLGQGEKGPKYLNSPASLVYHKARVLYGLHQARQAVASKGSVIIVEGYFDLLSLVSHGIRNVVAPCGTALTKQQLSTLARLTKRAYAVFDGDAAGFKAVERAAPDMLRSGLDVRVVFMPQGMDPDDFVRQDGPGAFEALLGDAPPLVDALIERVVGDAGRSIGDRAAASKRLGPILSAVTDPVARDLYAAKAAELLGTAKDAVLSGAMEAQGTARPRRRALPAESGRTDRHESLLVKVLLFHPELAGLALDLGAKDLVKGKDAVAVLDAFAGGKRDATDLLSVVSDGTRETLYAEMVKGNDPSGPAPDKTLKECVARMREKERKKRRRQMIEALSKTGGMDDLRQYQDMVVEDRNDAPSLAEASGRALLDEVENGE